MSRVVIDQLLTMLDQSFERSPGAGPTDGWHSLMANLGSTRDSDWDWLPPNGTRTICQIAIHCGFAMRMYADRGFGDGTLEAARAAFPQAAETPGRLFVLPWLRDCWQTLRASIDLYVDDNLGDMRTTHWGEPKTRRWFAVTVIEHNLYHAGEINHIRALAQENDRW